MKEVIGSVRQFSRAVTQRVGALNDRFLGRDRPLNQCRLIFEIGRDGANVRNLRDRLGFDSGYTSRLLRSLEQQGLIEVEEDGADRRVRHARLTKAGQRELAELDSRSDAFAASIVDALSESQRDRLCTAMAEVERLFTVPLTSVEAVEPDTADAHWCLDHYHTELAERFENGYDSKSHPMPPREEMMRPRGVFLVAHADARPIGCGAVTTESPGIGFITRMWVAPSARGAGLGSRLLKELERHASELGFDRVRLDTNRSLPEAQALYAKHGYREVEPFSHHPYSHFWFEKALD